MDAATLEMVLTAYDETYQDARGGGHSEAVAHAEGLTAAAMLLAAVTGTEDAAARAEIDRIDVKARLAA
ncbi:hypothetical protein [Magnetospirillum sp. SS-4]|uniref:hypothetical protein n=1 Tax=Magnetospirillum sp. SS-4 TaxID=2681465 RepID=UPI0013865C09|nr:hypothetical protein [Magnetospirillum sp. SS-4]CAA7614560.1 conserved hypothetical protein [Magnetospirillum sp. SS-4]